MLAFSMLVAGSFALGALAANEITPVALNAVRFWIAAGDHRGGGAADHRACHGRRCARLGAMRCWRCSLCTYFVLMFEGLKTAPPVSAAAVFTLTPMMAAGFGWLLLRQVLTPRMALALGDRGARGALGDFSR